MKHQFKTAALALLFVAALAGCAGLPSAHTAPTPAGRQELFPTRFVMQVDGYIYHPWQITLEGDHLVYTSTSYGGLFAVTRTRRIHPTAAQWRTFWQAADAVEVWNWRREYLLPRPILDGIQWSVSLAHGTRQVISEGNNAYPSDANPRKAGSEIAMPTGRYKRFFNAALQLIGVKPDF